MTLFTVSVPIFIKALTNLQHILIKGKIYAAEQGISESELLEARLFADMFPLVRQVQIASDAAKGVAADLAGVTRPVMEDKEQSFDELIARCQHTIDFLKTLEPAQFEGAETKLIPFVYVEGKSMTGEATLLESSLPNFFFHVTTAYAILRHKGVPLGKADFLGALLLQ